MADPGLPLDGVTVVVTRARTQASVLNERLRALGARAVSVATIEILPPLDRGAALVDALSRADEYSQLVVASPNGARALAAAVVGRDGASLPPVAAIGASTAAKLDGSPLRVNLVPERAVAEGLVEEMAAPEPGRDHLLLVQAEISRDVLQLGLEAKGWLVDRVVAYRTVDAQVSGADRQVASQADVITFTSSSTVERFVRLLGADALPPTVATIGPITSATARDLGLVVQLEADPHTIDGLVDALTDWASRRS